MKEKIPELMSPAGDWISLRSAIDAGCNAIYFGISGINMRAGAKNFTVSDLKRITRTCHKNSVKAYLTINVIIYDNEQKKIKNIITKAKKADIDAIIAWDLAVIKEAKKQKIPVIISTQMSISNSESARFFKDLGAKRAVLARELSLEQIKKIKKSVPGLEIEIFCHGAMCVSISGRCFISQFQYGRSANRGECIQPCRRSYLVTDPEEKKQLELDNSHVMSPKDLATLPFIEKIIKIGVDSLKIEGRNRSPEYVYVVTSSYRKAIDYYIENHNKKGFKEAFDLLKKHLIKDIKKVYNRDFSNGFLFGKPINEWCDTYGSKATHSKQYVGIIKHFYRKPMVAEIHIQSNEFSKGDQIQIQGPTTGVHEQKAISIEIENKKISKAKKETLVALKTETVVRKNDKVYVIKKN